MVNNMKAEPVLRERHVLAEDAFAEIVIWKVPEPVKGSLHSFKYRLAYVVRGVCVLRFDNEAGKGDHRHIGDRESVYAFSTTARLLTDFWTAVDDWRP